MLGLFVIAALVSCSIKDDLHSDPSVLRFRGTMEQLDLDASTRAFAEHNTEAKKYYIRWNANDYVSIFEKTTLNAKYRFMGRNGDPSGGFTFVSKPEHGTSDPLGSNQYAIYPYEEYNTCNEDGVLTVYIPYNQIPYDDEFGVGARLLMVATAPDGDFGFKHVGAYIGVSLAGEGVKISSISFQSNNQEPLSGYPDVSFDSNGEPVVQFGRFSDARDIITMEFPTPVQLSSEESVFWLIVPATTLTGGYTLSVKDENGKAFVAKKTTGSLRLERKKFYPLHATVDTNIPVSSISLNKAELLLSVGSAETLNATVLPEDATDPAVTWISDNPGVATVDATGNVTAVAAGEAIITATAGDQSATCTVTVSNVVDYSLAITPTSSVINAGESQDYIATLTTTTNGTASTRTVTPTLLSSDDNVATIEGASAKGIKDGTVTITASYTPEGETEAVTATATLKVNNVISYDLVIDPAKDAEVNAGSEFTFKLMLTTTTNGVAGEPVNVAADASWTSSDTAIATIAEGVATGFKEGTVTITAKYTTPDGVEKTQTAPLKVNKNPNQAGDDVPIGGGSF